MFPSLHTSEGRGDKGSFVNREMISACRSTIMHHCPIFVSRLYESNPSLSDVFAPHPQAAQIGSVTQPTCGIKNHLPTSVDGVTAGSVMVESGNRNGHSVAKARKNAKENGNLINQCQRKPTDLT